MKFGLYGGGSENTAPHLSLLTKPKPNVNHTHLHEELVTLVCFPFNVFAFTATWSKVRGQNKKIIKFDKLNMGFKTVWAFNDLH